MPRYFVQDYFLSKGYKYLLLDNIESKEDGSTVLHYELLNENLIENYYDDMIALDSNVGNEIIQESINGYSVIWIATEHMSYINSSGRLYQKQKFQKIIFKNKPMINFKFDNDTLLLMQEGDTEEYPSEWIPVRLFGNLDDYGEQRSFWIDYLDTQPWVPKTSLYFLAKIIQDMCPDNKIDWLKTFYKVELNLLVSNREKEILSQSPGKREFHARDYTQILESRLTAFEEIRATVSMAQIVAIVEKKAARYNVSLK